MCDSCRFFSRTRNTLRTGFLELKAGGTFGLAVICSLRKSAAEKLNQSPPANLHATGAVALGAHCSRELEQALLPLNPLLHTNPPFFVKPFFPHILPLLFTAQVSLVETMVSYVADKLRVHRCRGVLGCLRVPGDHNVYTEKTSIIMKQPLTSARVFSAMAVFGLLNIQICKPALPHFDTSFGAYLIHGRGGEGPRLLELPRHIFE
ncbi:hypothetical protein C8R46DRAFT_1036295 [Mycena filopes]|nr:hypothetical protein C8R46DRAFT_1036295 [Mycena filopes]